MATSGGVNPTPDPNILVENSDLPGARQARQINTKLPVSLFGTSAVMTPSTTAGIAGVNQLVGNNTNWAMGGAPASGTHGNNTTMVAGSVYWTQAYVETNQTLTGISVLTGGTGGTDSWIGALYSSTGVLVANSALAGTTAGTANNMTALPFTATYAAVGPGFYFIALQSNGTTAKFQSYTVPASPWITGSTTGVFGTLPAPLTVGTTYTNNVGPVSGVY